MTHPHDAYLPPGVDFSHRYVMVNGARLHCAIAGAGTPVLLIPG